MLDQLLDQTASMINPASPEEALQSLPLKLDPPHAPIAVRELLLANGADPKHEELPDESPQLPISRADGPWATTSAIESGCLPRNPDHPSSTKGRMTTKHRSAFAPQSLLPRYGRRQPRFEETFDKPDYHTIMAMDAEGDDIPNQTPIHGIPLQKVGVNRLHIPVTIVDPFNISRTVQLQCAVDAYASVAPDKRGIHVSRIGNLLANLTSKVYPSLQDYAVDLCQQLSAVQLSRTAQVDVSGTLSYLEAVNGVKDKISIEHLTVKAGAQLKNNVIRLAMGIGFNHITACPCVQQTYKHSFGKKHHELIKTIRQEGIPFITHSQRCSTLVSIENTQSILPIKDVLESLDAVIVRCQNTLPREFELLTVYRAHKTPQFLEDTLRNMLYAIYDLVGNAFPESKIHIRSSSMESIHDFDLSGEVEYSVQDLHALLSQPDGFPQPC